jgi:hypothetical protein
MVTGMVRRGIKGGDPDTGGMPDLPGRFTVAVPLEIRPGQTETTVVPVPMKGGRGRFVVPGIPIPVYIVICPAPAVVRAFPGNPVLPAESTVVRKIGFQGGVRIQRPVGAGRRGGAGLF